MPKVPSNEKKNLGDILLMIPSDLVMPYTNGDLY